MPTSSYGALAMSSSPQWEHRTASRAVHIAVHAQGVAFVDEEGMLRTLDDEGSVSSEVRLPRASAGAARLGDAWLVSMPKEPQLPLVRPGKAKPSPFAEGEHPVVAVAVSADAVAVARSSSVELWSHAGKSKWRTPGGGPWVGVALAGTTLAALDEEGSLAFFSVQNGEMKGSLRLASTEPASTWCLTRVDPSRIALALGSWVVVIDAATHKVVRRVNVRANVIRLVADPGGIVAGFEDGWVQVVDLEKGEPVGALAAHDGSLESIALSRDKLYSCSGREVRAWDRSQLGVTQRSRSPITAIASRGSIVAVGDQSGRLRVNEGAREAASVALGQPITAVYVGADDTIVASTSSVLVRFAKPWKTPHAVALRSPATAFAADATYAFVGNDAGSVDVYDVGAGEHVTSYELSDNPISALVRVGGHLVVGTGLDGRVLVVDVAEGNVVHEVDAHDDAFGVTCLSTDARGRIVASGSDDGSIALLDPAKGRVLARLRVRETPASIAFEGTGRRLGCTFQDGTAALVTIAPKTSVEDIGLKGASLVAWGGEAVFGLSDGRIERAPTKATN